MKLESLKRVYFIGIGGIGMSAVARFLNKEGIEVHGYDKVETDLTKALVREGMIIHYAEDLNAIPEAVDLVVYTPAIPNEHKELQYFLKNGYPVKKRAEVLGIISRSKKNIAVAGTHGKTTTSTILTHLLKSGGIDCSAFLGGIALNYGSNFISGKEDLVVVEADEYDRSFLQLSPDLAIILSMEADHLDIYGDLASLHETGFKAFVDCIKPGGALVVQKDWAPFFEHRPHTFSYGLEDGTVYADRIKVVDGYFNFCYNGPFGQIEDIKIAMPGRHNIENATSAITIALMLGVEKNAIKEALVTFKGIKRRFEFVYRGTRVTFIDDYAHHPSEVKVAIRAAKELYPGRKVTGIFQPHLYSRTRDFAEAFGAALSELDEPWLLDIYPARELPIEGVSSAIIYEQIENPNKKRINKANLISEIERSELDILLTIGAGDIGAEVGKIKNYLESINA